MDILGLPTIEVEQNLAKMIQPGAKDTPSFASMFFDFDGNLFHDPFADPMRPAKCQGQEGDELFEPFWAGRTHLNFA